MPTKSEVVYQRALHFRQLVSEVSIKHYEQKRFAEIVNDIFNEVFKDVSVKILQLPTALERLSRSAWKSMEFTDLSNKNS